MLIMPAAEVFKFGRNDVGKQRLSGLGWSNRALKSRDAETEHGYWHQIQKFQALAQDEDVMQTFI
jgi:hypothetical protein